MKTVKTISTIALLLCILLPMAATAQEHSKLWGKNGEKWDPENSRLRNFTDVGYKSGEEPIPDWPVGVNVTDFGAVPDDGKDDSQAFIDAIAACPKKKAVLVPRGRYIIKQQIKPQRDHFVLRGDDMYESVLFFPKYLDEINIQKVGWSSGNQRNTGTKGGFFHVKDGTEKSIENISFEFREQRKGGIWEYLGADAISYTGDVSNSWVRNVHIKNYDLGLKVSGTNISVINVVMDHFIGRTSLVGSGNISGFDALMGVMVRNAHHNLFHNIRVNGTVMHPVDMNEAPRANVFSKIRGETRTISFHGGSSTHNLYTDLNNYIAGGFHVRTRKEETCWGVNADNAPKSKKRELGKPSYNSTDDHVFVGYGDGRPEKITDTIWYEPIDPAQLTPRNIYLAQMEYVDKPLPNEPLPQPPEPSNPDVVRLHSVDGKGEGFTKLLKFDLRDVNLETVEHARLRISAASTVGMPFTLSAYSVEDDSWSQKTGKSNRDPETGSKLDSVELREDEFHNRLEFDVTPFVKAQAAGDNIVSLKIEQTGGGGYNGYMHGRGGGNAPMLIVEQEESSVPGPPSAPEGISSTPLIGNIILDWEDNPESDVATYNVYRAPAKVGSDIESVKYKYKYTKASGLTTSDFVDIQSSGNWRVGMMDHRLVYKYKITAVDEHFYESPKSKEFVAATKHPSNEPPAFSETVRLSNTTAGADYSGNLASEASDPESDRLYFMKVSGPDWLNVAQDGTLSGAPDSNDAGTNTFTFQVTAIGGSTQKTVDISVDTPGD